MTVMKEFVSFTVVAMETGKRHVFSYHRIRKILYQKHGSYTYVPPEKSIS